MEHITEALYMAAATAIFVLAMQVAVLCTQCVDAMFDAERAMQMQGEILREE